MDAQTPAAVAPTGNAGGREFVEGEIIVRFKGALRAADRAAALRGHGASVKRELALPGYVVARVPAQAEQAVAGALDRRPDVVFA